MEMEDKEKEKWLNHIREMVIETDTLIANRNKRLSQKIITDKHGRYGGTIIG